MKPRYLRIRFEKPFAPWRVVQDARVYVLGKRGRVDITNTVPAVLADAFWGARVGDRLPGRLFDLPGRLRRRGRRAPLVAAHPVVFRFAEIAWRAA